MRSSLRCSAFALCIGIVSAACASTSLNPPKAPAGPLEAAEAALAAHDCVTARTEARRTMMQTKVARALIVLGACDELEGNVQDALALYEDALSVDPRAIDASKRLATLLVDSGALDAALRVARRALELSPGNPDLWVVVATAWERKGDEERASEAFARAAEAFRLALGAHAKDGKFRLRYARVLIATGDLDEARKQIAEAIDLAHGDDDLLAETALAFSATGDPERCVDALDDALADTKTSDVAHRAVLLADRATCKYAAKDLKGARADADASLAIEPTIDLHLHPPR